MALYAVACRFCDKGGHAEGEWNHDEVDVDWETFAHDKPADTVACGRLVAEMEKRIAQKDPQLVVKWGHYRDGVQKLTTADGKHHFATIGEGPVQSLGRLWRVLSSFTLVPPPSIHREALERQVQEALAAPQAWKLQNLQGELGRLILEPWHDEPTRTYLKGLRDGVERALIKRAAQDE